MAEALAEAGVKRVYGIVGDLLNGFTDPSDGGFSFAIIAARFLRFFAGFDFGFGL